MSYCDDQYTFTPKPTAPSYTVNAKPTASYSVTEKATRPTTSITEEPCPCILCLLTEDEILITEEDGRGLKVEGAF